MQKLQLTLLVDFNEDSLDLTPVNGCDTLSELPQAVLEALEDGDVDLETIINMASNIELEATLKD